MNIIICETMICMSPRGTHMDEWCGDDYLLASDTPGIMIYLGVVFGVDARLEP